MYTCRNCSFKAGWRPGQTFPFKVKNLLRWSGATQDDIRKLDFNAWQIRETKKVDPAYIVKEWVKLDFPEKKLPEGSKPISEWIQDGTYSPSFLSVVEYLADRGEDLMLGYDYYWNPTTENDLNRRLLIPFKWDDKIVGYTARAIFPTRNRYYSDVPTGYIFNTQVLKNDWEYLFINEGPLDGIASRGIGMLGDQISPDQIKWITQTGRTPIVVPDREKEGGKLVDVALKEGWYVSFPKWSKDIKDAAAAAKAYGQLYTIWSLIDAKTNNKLQINIERQRLR